jgi:hypothetical protein
VAIQYSAGKTAVTGGPDQLKVMGRSRLDNDGNDAVNGTFANDW